MHLNQFLSLVYLNTLISILITMTAGNIVNWLNLNPLTIMLTGAIGSFVAISMFDNKWRLYRTRSDIENNHVVEYSKNSVIASYLLPCFIGLSISPIMSYADSLDTNILPIAMTLSLVIFGTATIYAFFSDDEEILSWKQTLHTALWSMAFMGLISIFFPAFRTMWTSIELYLGLILFVFFVVYDTYKAISEFKKGNYNYLQVSIGLYLDFINIFVKVVVLLIELKENEKQVKNKTE